MGLGHLVRSRALAEMLAEDFTCYFACRPGGEVLLTGAEEIRGVKVLDVVPKNETAVLTKWANQLGAVTDTIIVLDGYHFDTDYQNDLLSAGFRVVCIDDIHAYPFTAHAVINHASSARLSDYELADYTKSYFGLAYTLLRRPFREAAKSSCLRNDVSDVFVCLGGADPQNLTLHAVERCLAQPELSAHVVLGLAHPNRRSLEELKKKYPERVRLYQNLPAREMATTMGKCGLGITSPSGVALEFLSTGGHLFLLPYVDNQTEFYQDCLQKKLALAIDEFPFGRTDQELLRSLFDGRQQERYVKIFSDLSVPENEC